MKYSIIKSIFLFYILLLVTSCEQDALVDPPPFEKKPAIMCLMSPKSDVVQVSIAYTKPYYGLQTEETNFISDALVVLEEVSTKNKDTFFNYQPGMYQLSFLHITRLKPLEMYTLHVLLKDGSRYTASTTVPPAASKERFEITSVKMGSPYEDVFDGGPGGLIINPFAIQFEYDLGESGFYVSPQLEGIAKNQFGEEISVRISFKDEILSPQNNQKVQFSTQSDFYSGFGIEGPFQMDSFYGAIYIMDRAYKDFYKMQDLQYTDNPFSEPALFTNNFSNGALGIFGCYDYVQGSFVYRK